MDIFCEMCGGNGILPVELGNEVCPACDGTGFTPEEYEDEG